MPVDDHPIHDKVRHKEVVAGCYGKDSHKPGYWVQVRDYYPDGNYRMVMQYIPDVMSKECRGAMGWKINGAWTMFPECFKDGIPCPVIKDGPYISKNRAMIDAESK